MPNDKKGKKDKKGYYDAGPVKLEKPSHANKRAKKEAEVNYLGEDIKKYVREGDEQYLKSAYWELGDVLWYLNQIATLLEADMNEVAMDNLSKLRDREDRNEILGSGDDR